VNPAAGGTPGLLPIFLTVLVDVLALTIVLPLLPFYARHFGASDVEVGALFACFAACQLVSGPVLGRLSDRYGRKPVLVGSQAGTFAGLLVLASAPSLPWLFVGRAIDGLTAGNLGIAQAYITDVTPPDRRTRAFALIGIAFGLGFLVGPAASGWLALHHGYHAPPLAAAVLSALSIVLTATLVREPRRRAPLATDRASALSRFFRRAAPRARLLELFAYALSFSQITSGLALYLGARFGWEVDRVGYLFAFSGVVGGLVQGGIGRAAKRLGEVRLARTGFALMAVGYAALALTFDLGPLLVATAIGSVGAAVTRPAVTTLLTSAVDASEHGEALGVSQSLTSLAQTIGPLVAGALLHADLPAGWAVAAATAAGLGLLAGGSAPAPAPAEEGPEPARTA
jgi:MFS family permease